MKNKISKLLVLTLSLLLTYNVAFASTNVIPRTEDDLMVNSKIELTDQRIADILITPKVDASEKVYDFADLLSPAEEVELYDIVNTFVMNTNLDLALVTISENNKFSHVEYADDFYDYNDFGTDDSGSGLLFLIDMENRQIHITATGSAFLMYDSIRIEGLLDELYRGVSNEEYANAFRWGIEKATNYFNNGYPDSSSNYYIDDEGRQISSHDMYVQSTPILDRILKTLSSCIGFGFWGGIIYMIIGLCKSSNPKKSSTAKEYVVKDSLKIDKSIDDFVTTVTTSVKISSSSSSGGGGGSHVGGSGISHGGGSRGF